MRTRFALLVLALLTFCVGLGAADDPLVGTWKLNLAQSKYSPGPPPMSGTTKIVAVTGGIRLVANGVNDQGQATRAAYTAKFDGKDYPEKATIGGKPDTNVDAIAWKKIDGYTYESTTKFKGQAMTTTHYVISQDGRTRTNTVTGKNAQGQTVNNTVVYEKQ